MFNLSSFQSFLYMGGYAYYVWPSYIVVLVVLTGNMLAAQSTQRQVIKRLKKIYASAT